jgi:hypothetical protein
MPPGAVYQEFFTPRSACVTASQGTAPGWDCDQRRRGCGRVTSRWVKADKSSA